MSDPDGFVIGRAGVRAILARFASVPAAELEMVAGRGSRPTLAQGPEWLDFSFSRCAHVHVCALTIRRRIGVDVQVVESPIGVLCGTTPRGRNGVGSQAHGADSIAAGLDAVDAFCTPAERRRIARCAPGHLPRLLAALRTQKDALAKAVGAALAPAPDTIETPGGDEADEIVGDETSGGHGRLRLHGPLDRDDWHVATFVPVVGVAGAVVAEGEWTLTLATWAGVG